MLKMIFLTTKLQRGTWRKSGSDSYLDQTMPNVELQYCEQFPYATICLCFKLIEP